MKQLLVLSLFALLAACAPVETPVAPQSSQAQVSLNRFSGPPTPVRATRSNTDIAREFLDFHFELESGRAIPQFTRFEGPVSIAFAATPNTIESSELGQLVARLRSEAGIPISVAPTGSQANILINRITRQQLNSIVRGAACFVVPNIQSYDGLRARNNAEIDWTQVQRRTRAGVFIPLGISAQEFRDCIHEEVAQALGPLNDLYRVPDTVFNDDNMHRVLTSYDMMILRSTYSPILRSGMRRNQVAQLLPRVLSTTNPSGNGFGTRNLPKSQSDWKQAVGKSLFSERGNKASASRAISLAGARGYGAPRTALGYFTRGFANASSNRDAAISDFTRAYQLYSQSLGAGSIQANRAALQLASVEISAGKLRNAEALITSATRSARGAQDAGLLYKLLGLQAVIATAKGNIAQADRHRAEAQGWAAYAIGTGSRFSSYFNLLDKRIAEIKGQS